MQVQKKDGRLEDFDREKLKKSILLAGASEAEAASIAERVETWAPTMAFNNNIHSQVIRAKTIELLRQTNAVAAKAYEGYKENK